MWHATYNQRFLENPGENDATDYGVQIKHAPNAAMRCIGVHHLSPQENRGNHHVYLDVLDQDGQRLKGAVVCYTWQGRNGDPLRVLCDKPDDEPAANIPLYPGQVLTLWVDTGEVIGASDQVSGVHTAHPDEAPGNTRYHHSFYIVWQLHSHGHPAPQHPTSPEQPVPLTEVLHDLMTRLNRMHQDTLYIMEVLQKL
jgi:hypothetical protein